MACLLNIEHKIDKIKIYKRLHIAVNTETYRSADDAFLKLYEIIRENMKLTGLYLIVDPFDVGCEELLACIELKYQQIILDVLKKEVIIDAYLTEGYMIAPKKSMLYLYGLKKTTRKEYYINTVKTYKNTENFVVQESCNKCSNLNCQYRNAK